MRCRPSDKCRKALDELESLGTEEWSQRHTDVLREAVNACVNCKHEWHFFQQTISVIATTTQALPSPDQSRQMWLTCITHIHTHPGTHSALAQSDTVQSTQPQSTRDAAREAVAPPFWERWFGTQPTLGWVALGSAAAILAGVWLMAPHPEAPRSPGPATSVASLPVSRGTMAVQASFEKPPAMASPLLNNHAAMAFDPFNNHVGASLISYSAGAASPAAPVLRPQR